MISNTIWLSVGSAFTASDNLSLSSWVTTTSGFTGFQHPQSLSAIGTSTASLASPLPHPIQGSLPPYSRLGMPLTPSALASSMQGSGPTFPSFHMPRYHHYFQQGPYAAIQGLRHSSTVMTPFVWFLLFTIGRPDKISPLLACEDTRHPNTQKHTLTQTRPRYSWGKSQFVTCR